LQTVVRLIDNVISRPADPTVRRVRLANPAFQAKVARFPSCVDMLRAAGFTEETVSDIDEGGGALTLPSETEDRVALRKVSRVSGT
jgi:hypothetical protein